MGSNSSKLDNFGDVIMVPAKIRPMLMRRLADIKACASKGSSRKELLKDDNKGYRTLSNSSDYYVDSQRGSCSSTIDDENIKNTTKQQGKPEPHVSVGETCEEFKDAVESLPATPIPGTPEDDAELDDEIISKVASEFLAWSEMRAQSESLGNGARDKEEMSYKDDEEEDDDLRQRYISPGSPSFRFYYIESLASTMKDTSSFDEYNLEDKDENEKQIKTQRLTSVEVLPPESVKQKKGDNKNDEEARREVKEGYSNKAKGKCCNKTPKE
ncbi:hypothetical protein LINPERHAP2_LOCUS39781 [Linum perenne]